jgi:hypothetical protein
LPSRQATAVVLRRHPCCPTRPFSEDEIGPCVRQQLLRVDAEQ